MAVDMGASRVDFDVQTVINVEIRIKLIMILAFFYDLRIHLLLTDVRGMCFFGCTVFFHYVS